MKRWFALAVLLPSMGGGSAYAEVVWTGEGIIKSVSTGCGTTWQAGDFGSSIFRPVIPGNGANGTTSRLVFAGKDTVVSHEVNGAFSGDVAYQGTVISPSGILASFSPSAGIKNAQIFPAAFTANTQTLRIRATVNRFANVASCNVVFDGVYVKKP
jgi:hypothetical protein